MTVTIDDLNHYLRNLPVQRDPHDDLRGKALYLMASGVTVVPIDPRRAGWDCVVLSRTGSIGTVVHVDDRAISTAIAVELPEPRMSTSHAVMLWQAQVIRKWPTNTRLHQLAEILGDHAVSYSSLTFTLNSRAVREIAEQIDGTKLGTVRDMLAGLESGRLLVQRDTEFTLQLP